MVKEAKKKYGIKTDFDVPLSTIASRIRADNLTVWNTGAPSLVLDMEVLLCALVISAWECNYPLTVGETMQVANDLVEGTKLAADLIKWKKDQDCYDKDHPLLWLS